MSVASGPDQAGVARFVRRLPGSDGSRGKWPQWVPNEVVAALGSTGIDRPWTHQVELADAVHSGSHGVIATGTASGKTLAYSLPILAATYGGPEATAPLGSTGLRDHLIRAARPHTSLYLAPTKALAHDQARWCSELGLPDWRVAVVDGDTGPADREWARRHAAYVLTNPDLVHYSMLPHHTQWAGFLRTLRYIVVDECHRYRGVFGAHVSAVIRRLRRLCASYGAEPIVMCASATTVAPEVVASRLIGVEADEVISITTDAAAHPAREVVLWQPTGYHDYVAANWLADQVSQGRQSIAFVGSRVMAEVVAVRAQQQVGDKARIEAYRGGYLAADRRAIEADLQSGAVTGVAATNALELGVDISGMDTVIISGYPGTRAALWQQAGRAGRGDTDALIVLVARDDPLDAYLLDHPETLLDAPVEATIIFPDNPFVLGPHLAAAAQELPLTADDEAWFGPRTVELAEALTTQGVLRERPARGGRSWFWTHRQRPHDSIDLRAIGGAAIDVIDVTTGRVLGQADPGLADRSLHPGAIYLHAGATWLVTDFDEANATALVTPTDARYYTQPRSSSDMTILTTDADRTIGTTRIHLGEVELATQVVGYLRRDEVTGEVWDSTPLDMPVRTLRTQAAWWTLPAIQATQLGFDPKQLAGAAHAAEHAAIGLLPLFAPCDRWDIGGVSTVAHPQTGELTIFVYDGHPGGAGFAAQGYRIAEQWWAATAERLATCPCADGCPSCVVSPKCGSGNQPLDKAAAAAVMHTMLAAPTTTLRRLGHA